MKEIFKLSKREKKILKNTLKTELQKTYTDEEAEAIMIEVLGARDKVQEAMETAEKLAMEYKEIEEKLGVKVHKTPLYLKTGGAPNNAEYPNFSCRVL